MATKKITGTLRRLYMGLAVLAIIGLIFCFYYYYVSNKERKIQERNFHVLQHIEENFEKRIRDNRQQIVGKLKICAACTDGQGRIRVDSVREVFRQDEHFTFEDTAAGSAGDWNIISKGKNSRIHFYISNAELNARADHPFYIKISADVEKILASVLRYDVFPSYILTSKSGMAYNNCGEICQVPVTDSLFKNDDVSELKVGNGRFFVFSHPFSQGADQEVVLCGIVSAEQYAHAKYGVPGSFLLTIFLLLLVILLAFPFIKSFLMSAEESLDTGDVLLALLSLFLLCYMYIFMHMNTYTVSKDELAKRASLQTTSDSIKHAFLTELGSMRRQLKHYDRVFSTIHYPEIKASAGNQDSTLKPGFYADFNRIYWLNREGAQIGELVKGATAFSNNSAYNERDYHDRGYFKAVVNKALWYPDSADSDKIYLEPVYSRVDGSFRAVMSKESDTPSVIAAMSANMKSVINTIQPGEINFCLLNNRGDILFTSAGNEHINENLPQECTKSQELNAAIYARANTFFDSPFMGNNCSFYISPIEGLPLHLVTFTDNGVSGDIQLQVCIFTSLFILATLALFSLVILFLVLLKEERKNKIVKRPFLDLSMLYPSSNYLYRDFGGIFFNIVLMAGLAISGYICRNEPFTLLFLLLLNATGTTAAFCYARLDLKPSRRKCFWAVMILFFVMCDIFLLRTGAWDHKAAFISLVAYEALIFWVIYELRTMRYYEKDFPAFAGVHKDGIYRKILSKGNRSRLHQFIINIQAQYEKLFNAKFYHQYSSMLMTWFLLIALLPSILAYRYFYKNEQERYIKTTQIGIARQWFDKRIYGKDDTRKPGKPADSTDVKSYLSGFYGTTIAPGSSCEDKPYLQEALFNDLLNHFRFSLKSKEEMPQAVFPGNSDGTIRFCTDSGKISMTYQNLLNHPDAQGKNTVVVQSTPPGFPAPPARNFISFMLYFTAPFLFLILLYFVIRFFLKRFFLFEILPAEKEDDTAFFKRLLHKYNTEAFRLIILGVTSAGKKNLIKQAATFIYDEQNRHKAEGAEKRAERAHFVSARIFLYDLADIDIVTESIGKDAPGKGDIVVLSHFEHNLAEKEANDKKFMLISGIFGSTMIVLTCSF